MTQSASETFVIRLGVRTEFPTDAQELQAEFAVALDVLGPQAWTLGGETVGPAKSSELLSEGPRGPGEPFG
jgi:hypothetical protein